MGKTSQRSSRWALRNLYLWLKKHVIAFWAIVAVVVLVPVVLITDAVNGVMTAKDHFQADGLERLKEVENHAVRATKKSMVTVELVQTPKDQDDDGLIYDVHLKNTSNSDVLISSVSYQIGMAFASHVSGAHPTSGSLKADEIYEIPVQGHSAQDYALSPPYLLAPNSRGTIRFRFEKEGSAKALVGGVGFRLLSPTGDQVAAISAADTASRTATGLPSD